MNRWAAPAIIIATTLALRSPPPTATVRTESGLVVGVRGSREIVYKGIPFAAPPVGELRWRAPLQARRWTGVRNARQFSPVCMQTGSYPSDAHLEPMSEDCLYLNVWTPLVATTAKLPVMVWIYGGGLENGSASTPLYAGDMLVQKGVIVVTANYRLGAFGFLAHPDLTRESDYHSSGNYGLLDQIAALQWVQRNIAAFGGDPNRVTIFGQSSGSISISALATSPLARGLFQQAIGESGALMEPIDLAPGFTLAGAEKDGTAIVGRTGARSLGELRHRTAVELMKTRFDAHLIVDGFALPQSPSEAYKAGRQNNVALLIGSNADEGESFISGRTITVQNYSQELARDFPAALVQALGPQPGSSDAEARNSAADFERDVRFRWDMWTWARLAASSGGGNVFLYQFSRAPPYRAGDKYFDWGAAHGMEMIYVFDHLNLEALHWTPQDRTLASDMSSYWTNFAKSGDPNAPGLPAWPVFTALSEQLMDLDRETRAEPVQNMELLKRIDSLYAHYRSAR